MNSIKKTIALFCIIIITTSLTLFCTMNNKSSEERVKASFDQELLKLQSTVDDKLLKAVTKKNEAQIKTAFLESRAQYKRLEYYMEYFFPTTAVLINGAPIDEIELGENLIENPTGFQVMEELIYDIPTAENRNELLNEVKKMQLNLQRVARYNEQYTITNAQLFDAMRLELFRITSLGITGFDTPTALQSLPEAAAALEGIKNVITNYDDEKLVNSLKDAVGFLHDNSDFNSFNRLDFMTNHLQPIAVQLDHLRTQLKIPTASSGSALNDNTTSLFQKNAFNIDKFVSNHTEYISNDKIALGKQLFNSNVLSNGGNRSCASCHHENKAFTDGLVTAQGIVNNKALLRNTPTLMYSGLQRAFFYDLKAGSLEDQALDVVHHKEEMDGSLEQAAVRINNSKSYNTALSKAFKDPKGMASPWRIQHVLAAYIRSLSPFSSRVDKYMQGDKKQLNAQEKEGFNLFMGKAKCGTCHFAPLFNGTQAPLFQKSEAEVLGVPGKPDTSNAVIDKDLGRYDLNPYPQYKYAFKTTSLRNIAKTAPYMHNGVYKTLEEVLDFYNRGGGTGIGIQLDNQTLSADPLQLTPKETKSIIAFLKALDDQ
ncbi:cytochrome-c peroxidase [Pedobacter frigoris]|uniref:Cytochrome C peroxidase n=1 Tax=Pedobacter frigoris TaxID=2571272 RepID=A0A4U1CHY5_9SPHI|nr:cytochrome c peroxidase [Pedobacter frigoris]TKC06051.1 cytochrome C peroxidase [Pedobacter frigoris]